MIALYYSNCSAISDTLNRGVNQVIMIFNSSDQAFLLCMDVDVTTSSQGPSQNPSIVIRRLISSNPVCFEWFEPIELFLEPEYYKTQQHYLA